MDSSESITPTDAALITEPTASNGTTVDGRTRFTSGRAPAGTAADTTRPRSNTISAAITGRLRGRGGGCVPEFGEQPFLVLAELGDETGQHGGAIAAVAEQPTHLASGQGVIDGRAARVRLLRELWRIPLAAGSLAACWVRLIRGARRTSPPDAVLVGYLGHLDVWLARLLFPRTPIALDHLVSLGGTAWDRGLASGGGMKRRILDAVDRGALRRADVAIVDTPENAPAIRTGSGDAVVVPVGAERVWFAGPA
jgi:hypothetical protein